MGRNRLPRRQRLAAYAVIIRDGRILLSKLAPRVSRRELWTLPGGGVDHGEDPRLAVVREVQEETGLDAMVSRQGYVYSRHIPRTNVGERSDYHAVRLVFEGWVRPDAAEPHVVEVDGTTVEAAWHSLAEVAAGRVPVTELVTEALVDHEPFRMQRIAAYALIRRDDAVLLTRISERGFHSGSWTLPGGGIDHGERPAEALVREVEEECGIECRPGVLLDVHDTHFSGTAPSGRHEDFHGIHLIFAAEVPDTAEPRVVEVDGTTDAVAWVPLTDIESGTIPVLDVVRHALAH